MSLNRFGDRYHAAFSSALACRTQNTDTLDAQAALSELEAHGHQLLDSAELAELTERCVGRSPAFSRLELLAWRALDDEQDRFAQAFSINDQRGTVESISRAACYLELIHSISGKEVTA